jgi:hypothetical protein
LRARGLTHLVTREDLLKRFFDNNVTPAEAKKLDDFARARLTRLYQDGRYAVYQING